jgi:hypothetical protein
LDSRIDYGYDYYSESEKENSLDHSAINKVLDHLNTMVDVAKASISSFTGFLESISAGVQQLKGMAKQSHQ